MVFRKVLGLGATSIVVAIKPPEADCGGADQLSAAERQIDRHGALTRALLPSGLARGVEAPDTQPLRGLLLTGLNAWPPQRPARVVLLATTTWSKSRQTTLIFRPAIFNRELDDAL